MFGKSHLFQQCNAFLNHHRVPAQEHVGVVRVRLEPPRLFNDPIAPEILDITRMPRPGQGLLIRPVENGKIVEVAKEPVECLKFRTVSEIPGMPGAVKHRHLSLFFVQEKTAKHAHVRRKTCAGCHQDNIGLFRNFIKCEHAGEFWAEPQGISRTEVPESWGQRTGTDQGDVKLEIFPLLGRRCGRSLIP